MRKAIIPPGFATAGGPARIPGQGPRLILDRSRLRTVIDTSAFSELTAPPKELGRPVYPGGEGLFRDPSEVVKGLGLGYEGERKLEQKLRDWATEPDIISFRRSLIGGLRALAPDNFALRNELTRRSMAFYKAAVGQRFDRRPGRVGQRLVLQKGGPAQVGEVREWQGGRFRKVGPGQWEPVDGGEGTAPAQPGSHEHHSEQARIHTRAALAHAKAAQSAQTAQEAGQHQEKVQAAQEAEAAIGQPQGAQADIPKELQDMLAQALQQHGADKVKAALTQATQGTAQQLDSQMQDKAKELAGKPEMKAAAKNALGDIKGQPTDAQVKAATEKAAQDPGLQKVAEAELKAGAEAMGEQALGEAAGKAAGEKKPSKFKAILKAVIKGGAGSFVFGFLDNFIMYCAGASIDGHLAAMGFSTAATAGVGNAISDAMGETASGQVENLLEKVGLGESETGGALSEKTEKRIKGVASVAGVFTGALAGMVPMLFGVSFGKSLTKRPGGMWTEEGLLTYREREWTATDWREYEASVVCDDSLVKSRSHKYIRKYVKNGRTIYVYSDDEKKGEEKHRYSEEDKLERLTEIGDALYAMQASNPRELDDAGLSRFDMDRWRTARGDVKAMTHVLAKYRRQIKQFGEEEHALTGLADFLEEQKQKKEAGVWITPKIHPKWGSVQLPLDGRIPRSKFDKYLKANNYLKEQRLVRFDGATKTWFIPKTELDKVTPEIWAEFSKRMEGAGIKVGSFPEIPKKGEKGEAKGVVEHEPTADEVIEALKARQEFPKTIAVKRDGEGMFHFYSPFSRTFNEVFSNKAGMISGITEYDPDTHARKTYDLALVEEAIDKLKSVLPDWKIVTDGVKEAQAEREIEEAELKKPIPKVAAKMAEGFKLFPYQNEAVRFLIKNDGCALVGDEMGLGKTLQSLAYVASENKRVLVVVPKVVRRTWIQEAEKFFPDYFKGKSKELISADIKKHGMPDLKDVNIASVNYESLHKFMPAIKAAGFDTIVVDESHRMKSPKAKITKRIMSLRETFPHRMLLSGTAVKNKKDELHTQTEFIRPGLFSKYELKMGTIGGVWNKLKRTLYIARQKRTVLPDLPDKITQITESPVPGMPGFPSDIGEMSRARIEAALAKAPATADFVKEALDTSDSSLLVFSESKEAAEQIAAELGPVAILHHGQMSDNKREAAKAEFQREGTTKRVFVSTRQSLAVGATLTAADKVVFNDIPWTAADLRQAEDRVHRVGQKNNVNVYWITGQDSAWDKAASAILLRKYELNRKINEGKQLTEAERKWMTEPVKLDEIRKELGGKASGPKEEPKLVIPVKPEKKIKADQEWLDWLAVHGKGGDTFRQIESLGGYKEARKRYRAEQAKLDEAYLESRMSHEERQEEIKERKKAVQEKKVPKPKKKTEQSKPKKPSEQMLLFGEETAKSLDWDVQLERLRPRMMLRRSTNPLELIWCAEEIPDELHEREERTPPGWPADELAKGAGHKYVKRVPTGKIKPKYRYYYKIPGKAGLVSSTDLAAGAKFKIEHGGQKGHFEIHEHDEASGQLKIKHDESGRQINMHKRDLHRLLQRQAAGRTRKELKEIKEGPKPLKLRRPEQQPELPGTGKKEIPPKEEKPKPEPKKEEPKPAAAKLARVSMDALGSGEYDGIDGFAQSAEDLEQQASLMNTPDREYAVVQQAGGFALVSKPKKMELKGGQIVGDSVPIFLRGAGRQMDELKGTWKVVEADSLIASHHPESFDQREDYPLSVQERAYHSDKSEQHKVEDLAHSLVPAMLINNNPDAVNGAPIVTSKGIVLGGNGRTMGIQRAYNKYPESAEKLKKYLAQHARAFGMVPSLVSQMKRPVLVREVAAADDTKELTRLGRRMNESFTQGLDPRAEEVAVSKFVSQDVVDVLTHHMETDETLSKFLARGGSRPFVETIRQAGIIDERNQNKYLNQDTMLLNEDGRERVSRVLAARLIPDSDLLNSMDQSWRENLGQSVPSFLQAERAGWDLKPALVAAVKADMEMAQKNIPRTVEGRNVFLEQIPMFEKNMRTAEAEALLEILQTQGKASKKLPKGFKNVARIADQQAHDYGDQGSMFAVDKQNAAQALSEAFGIKSKLRFAAMTKSLGSGGLRKADEGAALVRYMMHGVNWELENLVRAAVTAAGGEGGIDGERILNRLRAWIVDRAYEDRRFAQAMGAHPLTSKTLEGLLQAHAKARMTDLSKSIAKSMLWNDWQKARNHAG